MNNIENVKKEELLEALINLAEQAKEDMPEGYGSKHFWDAIEEANRLTSLAKVN